MIKGRKRGYSKKVKKEAISGGKNGKPQQYWKLGEPKYNHIKWI